MTLPDTRTAILDAAEAMFAEHGYAATPLRRLTAAARVNLAAVSYHFGSKEDLAKAVLARAIQPINDERLRRLDALRGRAASVEAIVRAFVEPPLRTTTATACRQGTAPGQRLCRVFGRISVEQPPFLRAFVAAQFREVGSRFAAALALALPGSDATTIWWRLHFVVGAMAHTLQNSSALAHLTGGLCDATDIDALVEQLVVFAVGGARSPMPRRISQSARRGSAKRKVAR